MDETASIIEFRGLPEALSDSRIFTAIREITDPHYQNPLVLLDQEAINNDHIYLSWRGSALDGFFMTGWQEASKAGQRDGCVYLGLSGVHPSQRGKGLGTRLYRRFLLDSESWVTRTERPLWYWFYTASPFAASAWHRMVPSLSPSPIGDYDPRALHLLESLAPKHGWAPHRCPRHPFLLRKFATARYAQNETEAFISSGAGDSGFLSRMAVDEQSGDRVIFVGVTESAQGRPKRHAP